MEPRRVKTIIVGSALLAAVSFVGAPGSAEADGIVCGSGHVLGRPVPVQQCQPPCPGVSAGPVFVGSTAYLYVCVRP